MVKEPEKLKQAVAIALEQNPSPSESDFAAAANKVVPQLPRKKQSVSVQEPLVPKIQESVVSLSPQVTISSQSHPRYGESGTIEADPPNYWQQIVTFANGERELVNNAHLDASSVPYPTVSAQCRDSAHSQAVLGECTGGDRCWLG
ncbi:hypothetical protein [Chlorogloeopsis fritschii]|uniref:hypothetical protein n=1 Tax=Chlorogloeopsis fritschii TaxID=1124 RepID=UPI0023F78BE2|nr:hypothetical protein [Chlorogloeopsis fritschii]